MQLKTTQTILFAQLKRKIGKYEEKMKLTQTNDGLKLK